MTDPEPPRGSELVPDAWRELDDTLSEGPGPAEVPAEARQWLADQRFVHGLLRALHTADAAAREARIDRVLECIDAERAAAPRRHWLLVGLAALLLAALSLWFVLPPNLPTAEAAVARAAAELARDVNRRFRVEMIATDRGGAEFHQEFALVTAPGKRFRLDGKLAIGNFQLGELRLGSDGQELWMLSANGMLRRAVPLAEREQLFRGMGDFLDIGYLDVHDLVEQLPGDFDLRVVGRESGADGRAWLRIEGTRRIGRKGPIQSMQLLCDEASGMVVRADGRLEVATGASRQLHLQYLGEESPGLVDYRRPW